MRFRAISTIYTITNSYWEKFQSLCKNKDKENDKLTMNFTVHTLLSIRSNKSCIIISMLLFIVFYGSIPTIITCFIKKLLFNLESNSLWGLSTVFHVHDKLGLYFFSFPENVSLLFSLTRLKSFRIDLKTETWSNCLGKSFFLIYFESVFHFHCLIHAVWLFSLLQAIISMNWRNKIVLWTKILFILIVTTNDWNSCKIPRVQKIITSSSNEFSDPVWFGIHKTCCQGVGIKLWSISSDISVSMIPPP